MFQTSVGFFDLAVAAPSMKAAAESWGSDTDIFKQGFAKETDEPEVVKATMAAPGVVLRRPIGSKEVFSLNPSLPKLAAERRISGGAGGGQRHNSTQGNEPVPRAPEGTRKEAEAERKRERKPRERIIAKADAALDRARRRHEEAMRSIERRRSELAEAELRENQRWDREQQVHKEALKG